jgi:hypothetical protein
MIAPGQKAAMTVEVNFRDLHYKLTANFLIRCCGFGLPTQALAAESTDCPHIVWKNGHYVCSIVENG